MLAVKVEIEEPILNNILLTFGKNDNQCVSFLLEISLVLEEAGISDYISDICISSIDDLNKLEYQCQEEIIVLDNLLKKDTFEYPSNIYPIDIASLPLLYGTLSGFLSSSEKLNEYLNKVHDVYAKKVGYVKYYNENN